MMNPWSAFFHSVLEFELLISPRHGIRLGQLDEGDKAALIECPGREVSVRCSYRVIDVLGGESV